MFGLSILSASSLGLWTKIWNLLNISGRLGKISSRLWNVVISVLPFRSSLVIGMPMSLAICPSV